MTVIKLYRAVENARECFRDGVRMDVAVRSASGSFGVSPSQVAMFAATAECECLRAKVVQVETSDPQKKRSKGDLNE